MIAIPASARSLYMHAVHLGVGGSYGAFPQGRIDNNDTLDDAEFSSSSLAGVRGIVAIKIASGRHPFFGIGLTYRAARGNIELDYDIQEDTSENDVWLNNTGIEMFFGWHFLRGKIRPFAYGGMGYAFSRIRVKLKNGEEHSLNGQNLPFFVAGGLDYMLQDRISIGGQLRGEYLYNLIQYGTGSVEIRADSYNVAAIIHVGIHF